MFGVELPRTLVPRFTLLNGQVMVSHSCVYVASLFPTVKLTLRVNFLKKNVMHFALNVDIAR